MTSWSLPLLARIEHNSEGERKERQCPRYTASPGFAALTTKPGEKCRLGLPCRFLTQGEDQQRPKVGAGDGIA